MACPVVEWQMLAKNPDSAASFYSGLFGWTVDANNSLGYRRIATGGFDGGIWPSPSDGHNLVQLFVGVDSVAEYHHRAEEMGAKTIVAPQRLPDGDELAIMLDPSGMPFGLLKKRVQHER
jgi:uncharacterized protein